MVSISLGCWKGVRKGLKGLNSIRAGEMAHGLRVGSFTEDQNMVGSTRVRQLTTACNSNYIGI